MASVDSLTHVVTFTAPTGKTKREQFTSEAAALAKADQTGGAVTKLRRPIYRLRWRDPAGASRSKTFERKTDADAYLATVEASKQTGTYVDPAKGKQTFRAFCDQWQATHEHAWRPGTVESVERIMRLHVYPTIGDRPIGAIERPELQRLVNALLSSGQSVGSVGLVRKWLGSVFSAAVEDGVIARSPSRKLVLPKQATKQATAMPLDTVRALAATIEPRYSAMVILAAGTGVRLSEALGLTWDRIDFEAGTVRVDRQLVEVVDGKPVFGPVKDRDNEPRTIPLPETVAAALRAHRDEYEEGMGGLVFTSGTGAPVARSTWSKVWTTAARSLGLCEGQGVHQLRHFYASVLIRAGESVKVVQHRLGHATPTITLNTYAHMWPEDDETTRAAVDAVLA